MIRKRLWLLAYILTGFGLIISSVLNGKLLPIIILILVTVFYLLGLGSQNKELNK